MTVKKQKVVLTKEQIEDLLRQGAKGADELNEALERSHLAGYSQSMAMRLR